MPGGAAAAGRSRPPTLAQHIDGVPRYGVYSLFQCAAPAAAPAPLQQQRLPPPHYQKVSESLFSTSVSAFGVPTPPPGSPYSPLQLELLKSYSHQVLLEQTKRDVPSKMDDPKLAKQCFSDSVTCCGLGNDAQRQMLENVTSIMQPLSIKTEHLKRSCNTCPTNSPKKVVHGMEGGGGCSRTNPVAWTSLGMAGHNVHVQVKREPHAHAQHVHMSDLVAVKLEQSSPGTKHDHHTAIPASFNNGTIPVGIAVARQRVGDTGAGGLLAALSTQKDQQHRMHDLEAAAMTVGVGAVGGALLHCEERAPQLAGCSWPVTSHAPPAPLAPPPTALWQYPAQMSMDNMMVSGMGVGVGVGMGVGGGGGGGGGYQLVREPSSGALLLLPAPPAPDLAYPQAVLWGGYPSAPLLLPPQPPHSALQLLGGSCDLLASATLHQHTQTHSTRLVTLAAPQPPPPPPPASMQPPDKRKPLLNLLAPHALIKIEPDHAPPDKLYYQPPPPPQPPYLPAPGEPVACLTPPPDPPQPLHRDASNQTDAQPDDDDDSPNHADDDERDVACVGVAVASPTGDDDAEPASPAAPLEPEDALDTNSSSGGSHDLVIDCGGASPASPARPPEPERPSVDVSGLELLSNSIEQFETLGGGAAGADMPPLDPPPPPMAALSVDTRLPPGVVIKTSPKSPPRSVDEGRRRFEFPPMPTMRLAEEARKPPSLDGLGLLCALAEQRFMEEVEDGSAAPPPPPPPSRVHVKSEPPALLSPADGADRPPREKKERRKTRDESPERGDRKRHHEEERSRYKFEKIRRHREERESRDTKPPRPPAPADAELLASYRRVASCACGAGACTHVPSAADVVHAIERDMRDRLADLQRQFDEKRAQLHALEPSAPSPTSSLSSASPSPPDRSGSSKKRKVGRPKKLSSPDSTETIVAKKPKSKSSLVGYLLAAKSRLNLPSKGGIIYSKGEDPSRARTSKVRPKLKAEPKVKDYSEEEEAEWGSQSSLARSASSSMESLHEVRLKNRQKTDRIALKHGRTQVSELEFAARRESNDGDKSKRRKSTAKSPVQVPSAQLAKESRCTLTESALDSSPRVLTARGGLFYAGRLSAVQAPDVYAVTLDGERGNKPHILSREETLRDAILEVTPGSARELRAGARLCAYWSQQYRCLYPGTAADAADSESDDKFVSVEFDDGDSGRIAIEDIRLLEPNYPVVEYDPNPLLTLGKRRRNTSVNSTEDRKSTPPSQPVEQQKPSTSETVLVVACKPSNEKTHSESEDKHRDRKKLKKHRKEKLKRLMSGSLEENPEALDYIKKKKKKHKCYDDHCKHRRHHKKHHRKHRKRHSGCKEHSSSSGDDHHRHKSSSEGVDSNKSNEDSHDSSDQISTLVAMEKSPEEDMKTVIKKTVVSKRTLVKNAILDFSKKLKEAQAEQTALKDNLKDSGIGMEVDGASSVDNIKKQKSKKRTVSSTSSEGGGGGAGVSKMAAFLPGGQLWSWHGSTYRRVAARPRHRKLFYKSIQRGNEVLSVGDCAVFLSTGRPDRPYIGRIVSLWEARGAAMAVKVKWFYHPEETVGFQSTLKYPGGLFESPHTDENDVQTISHKCEVLSLTQYQERMGGDSQRYTSVYDNNDVYYLVGHYDPTPQTIKLQPDIPFAET